MIKHANINSYYNTLMTDKTNSKIIEELVDIIDNYKIPIKQKKKLLKLKLNIISSILNTFPNKESVTKIKKIKILIKNINNIKTNAELRKIFNLNLLYNLLSFNDNSSSKTQDKKFLDTKLINLELINIDNNKVNQNSLNSNLNNNTNDDLVSNEEDVKDTDSLNNTDTDALDNTDTDETNDEIDDETYDETDDESDDETDDETDEETDDETDDDTDNSDKVTNDDELTSNNELDYLINDLPDKEKINLLLRITKIKNDHIYKMQFEMNKHKEKMNDKKIKELKIQNKLLQNKYHYKLELMKEKNRYNK